MGNEYRHALGAVGQWTRGNFDLRLTWLFELGRQQADGFLRDHFDKIGNQSSVDIEQRFL